MVNENLCIQEYVHIRLALSRNNLSAACSLADFACGGPLARDEALFDASQGVMQRIDALAHHALAAAASSRAKLVEPEHVVEAAEELRA